MDQPAVTYAGFWKRFLAVIIDGFLIGIVQFFIFVPFFALLGFGVFSAAGDENFEGSGGFLAAIIGAYLFTILLATVISWLYYALMEASSKQATLGKMALGIKVTDLNGNRISFGRATGRYFGKIISGLILYIGFIMAAFTQRKQALHDMMAGCLVVNK